MTWVKVDDRMPEHPKVASLSDRAFRVHIEALCYCSGFLTDGEVTRTVVKQKRWPERAVGELVTAGLWEPSERGWVIHDYLSYQRSRQGATRTSEARAEAGSRGGRAAANSKQIARGLLQESDSRSEKKRSEEEEIRSDQNPPTPRKRGARKDVGVVKLVDAEFRQKLAERYPDVSRETLDGEIDRALGHDAALKYHDKQAYVAGWIRREVADGRLTRGKYLTVVPSEQPEIFTNAGLQNLMHDYKRIQREQGVEPARAFARANGLVV